MIPYLMFFEFTKSREALVPFGSVAVWGWNGSSGSGLSGVIRTNRNFE